LQRLRELEYNALKSAVVARKYIDIARSLKSTSSYASKLISRLEKKGFKLRGNFDYSAIGLKEYLAITPLSMQVFEKPIPFIIEKTLFAESKRKLLAIRALIPVGCEKDFADILQIDTHEMWSIAYFSWNPYASRLSVLSNGKIISKTNGLTQLLESKTKIHVPIGKQLKQVDSLDLELMAELTRQPFLKLSELSLRKNMKNQTLNYHYTNHVKPVRLENLVIITPPQGYMVKIVQLKTPPHSEAQVAWALSNLHYVLSAYALLNTGIVLCTLLPDPYEEKQLAEALHTSSAILDFSYVGYVIGSKRYTIPFGDILQENTYNIEAVYQALYSHRRKIKYEVYEL
jgi:hypothetical protein